MGCSQSSLINQLLLNCEATWTSRINPDELSRFKYGNFIR